ncbi:MAG: hypothetical protein KDB22_06320 [Planctomycetales bacterium]|nr:hypothetical protein [Planctomycetales bacterium]
MNTSASDPAAPKKPTVPTWYLVCLILASFLIAYVSELVTAENKERFFTATGLPPFPPELLLKVMWDNIYNHSICFGFLGAVLCGTLTMISGGLVGPARAISGFLLGSAFGLVMGAAAGITGYFISDSLTEQKIDSIIKAVIVFTPVWAIIGSVASACSMLILGRLALIPKAIGMSIAMALFAAITYPLIVTALFPNDWPGVIIPEFARTRLVCFAVGGLCVSLGIVFTLQPAKEQRTKSADTAGTDTVLEKNNASV